ncbi:MAG: NDP-sugar synthase [Clostridia bacterium]|nr:NDP-sugar synthase [Clostridia bacterium]
MSKIKALILAGGRGTRLAPITDDLPKPLVPVANEPIITHVLRALKKSGVSEAAVALGYGGEAIKEYLEAHGTEGVSVKYFDEETPLGTAGSAAGVGLFFESDFVSVGGDTLFDFDIAPAFEYHKNVGAVATILMSRADDPRRYGSALTDSCGRITSFIEKPDWRRVRGDAISTGIYILSPRIFDFIPRGKFCDFAKDVFPSMVGGALFAYSTGGYFCDVGTPASYLVANADATEGRINGEYARTSVSPKAHVSPTANIERSVVMDGAVIGDGATVADSVVCRGAIVKENATVHRAVVAAGDVVKKYTVAPTNADICAVVASNAAKAAAAERVRAGVEAGDELLPDGVTVKYTVTGKMTAPHGAAKTVGELVRRGAKLRDDGILLAFDGADAVVACADANTLEISVEAPTKETADAFYAFALNGIKNLF